MASSLPLLQSNKIGQTLAYFDKYDFPLTKEELVYWQSTGSDRKNIKHQSGGNFYFLSGRQKIVVLRKQRAKISQDKWVIAKKVGDRLKKFNFIQAVFVTGSLAMNNAKLDDDIDLMIVTTANSLWITRFFVNLYLFAVRRYPNQKQVSNVVCINLWLDENNLPISPHNLYIAHEIIQAKVLWERNNIGKKFLAANGWVKEFLPNAYPNIKLTMNNVQKPKNLAGLILNPIFYVGQYLYMLPKMTTERVGLGFAFFHPRA